MKSLTRIREQIASGAFELSRHALRRVVERNISEAEIREAGQGAILIENYPADKYSPSCLVLGFTHRNRPLHIQVSRADTELIRIITIYEPGLDLWAPGFIERK